MAASCVTCSRSDSSCTADQRNGLSELSRTPGPHLLDLAVGHLRLRSLPGELLCPARRRLQLRHAEA